MVALADDGSLPVNSRSFHEHKNLPEVPPGHLEVCARTPLDARSRRTGSHPADTLPLDHDRREEEPGRSLNLEVVSATSVISLLLLKQGDNPFAAFESSSVRGFVCLPSPISTRNPRITLSKEAAYEIRVQPRTSSRTSCQKRESKWLWRSGGTS